MGGCKVDLTLGFYPFIIIKVSMREYVQNKVYYLRKESGATQEELAQAVYVTRQTIIAIEKGNYTPSILLALKIANFFKKPVDEIFQIKYEK